jgi:uncharacterized membrane protein YkoI
MGRMPAIAPLLVVLGGLVCATAGQAASGRHQRPPADHYAQPVDRDNDRGGGRGSDRGGDRDEREARVSLDDAVSLVRSRRDGKVIRAETRYSDGRPVHYIRVLTPEGRVYTVVVDGVSGRAQ